MPQGITAITRIVTKKKYPSNPEYEYILYDIISKREVMKGNAMKLAKFLKVSHGSISSYVTKGHICKKRYKVKRGF